MGSDTLKPQFDNTFSVNKEYSRRYMRTVTLMMLKAIDELIPEKPRVRVEFCYSGNYYVSVADRQPSADFTEAVKAKMKEYVARDYPVERKPVVIKEAIEQAEAEGDDAQARILNYFVPSRTFYYVIDGYAKYFCDTLLEHTGEASFFDLIPYEEGMLLMLPNIGDRSRLCQAEKSRKLFEMQKEGEEFASLTGMDSLADLNDAISSERAINVVLMQEAYFEKQLVEVAKKIVAEKARFVLIAGPSSSGKTTTTHRLALQLKTFGLDPQVVSADDYFHDHDHLAYLPDGNVDFESIRAVDTEQFNNDMLRLLAGEEVEIPSFNFAKQEREYRGKKISLSGKKVVIIEGIHCLNPEFSRKIPDESKLRVFMSAMTPLNVNDHTPISTSDCRLLRRIVRDNRTRGVSAAETLAMWPGVRNGEEQYIYPYQELADIMINSTMVYELSVLKLYAAPLLFGIKRDDPMYRESRRLLKFLDYVLPVTPDIIPGTSIIREFIGGSLIDIS